ncbi:MAG: aspartate aminotransferase family protein [Candidatus Eisenbacteria bacterium]|nr:aspartate aminotransferase family protein [Candidatus Eisenbacteria bacterium]
MADTIATAPAQPVALAEEELALFAPVYPLPRLEIASGRGAFVRDADGREYLDFVSGIAVNALGHAPAGIARAVARQLRTLAHCSNLFANRPALELARALAQATGYERVFFCNSGTEAVEAALKFARARARARGTAAAPADASRAGSGGRDAPGVTLQSGSEARPAPGRDVLAFRGGFHGRTAFALSATWTPAYREPFEPLVPGVRFADFNRVDQLDAVLDEGVAAVIVEPVQGEGGVIPATREFLQALRARTAALGAALVFDEVQCGMGRCGRLLASEEHGVRADYVVLSKALGGGLPLGAVLMTAEAAQALQPGMHGCTFGGGPVAATAGAYVLARVRKPGFLARVRRQGRTLGAGLERLVARHASLAEARGVGLLRAVEIAAPAPWDPPALVAAARAHGLLLARGGERAVRLLPPLTVTGEEIALALERLERAIAELEAGGEQG